MSSRVVVASSRAGKIDRVESVEESQLVAGESVIGCRRVGRLQESRSVAGESVGCKRVGIASFLLVWEGDSCL